MKNLLHLGEEEGTRLCLCKGFVVRIGVIVMIEREKRMCGNFVVKSVRYFVLVNISLKELIQHFVERPSGIDWLKAGDACRGDLLDLELMEIRIWYSESKAMYKNKRVAISWRISAYFYLVLSIPPGLSASLLDKQTKTWWNPMYRRSIKIHLCLEDNGIEQYHCSVS